MVEIAVVVLVVVVLVLVVLFLVVLIHEIWAFSGVPWGRKRPRPQLKDLGLTATRERVLVSQPTDIRFRFSVSNPTKAMLGYWASLQVEGHAEVQRQNPGFNQDELMTFVPLLNAKWDSVGTKSVVGTVTLTSGLQGRAEGWVEVVAESD